MNKWIAIPVITVLAVGVSAAGYFVLQQTNKLREAESEIVALEENVSALDVELADSEVRVSTLEENVSVLEVELTGLEAKVSTLEADLDKADVDVKTQQKLVGQGSHAEWSYPGETDVNYLSTGFIVTNPDGVSEITIDRISVFAFDGTVIYEGLLRVKVNEHWEVYTGPLKPHEIVGTDLKYYDLPELTREVEMQYTVEIFWTWTDKEGLPLIGWASSFTIVRDAEGLNIDIIMHGGTQMVNME